MPQAGKRVTISHNSIQIAISDVAEVIKFILNSLILLCMVRVEQLNINAIFSIEIIFKEK